MKVILQEFEIAQENQVFACILSSLEFVRIMHRIMEQSVNIQTPGLPGDIFYNS